MSLPPGFRFSQGSLQDFVDCPRRFQLRYLLRLAWPAIESEPVLESERLLRQGARFHRLVQQHMLGVPLDRLSALVDDEDLERWWSNYLRASDVSGIQEKRAFYSEIGLSSSLGRFRLVAQYDLIVVGMDHRLVIVDWKTSQKRTKRRWLLERLQTRVYPYLLVRAGSQFLQGTRLSPEMIEMVYWFANSPDQPEMIRYDQLQFTHDESYLMNLVADIDRRDENEFNLTPDSKRCVYCVYRSLCERGLVAGDWDENYLDAGGETSSSEILLNFNQINEIEF